MKYFAAIIALLSFACMSAGCSGAKESGSAEVSTTSVCVTGVTAPSEIETEPNEPFAAVNG